MGLLKENKECRKIIILIVVRFEYFLKDYQKEKLLNNPSFKNLNR